MSEKRCKKGTRKNKKTGNCEPKKDRKRCKNGTRKNKRSGRCESRKYQLTSEQIEELIDYGELSEKQKKLLRKKLPKLGYDEDYEYHYSDNKHGANNLFSQAKDKVERFISGIDYAWEW